MNTLSRMALIVLFILPLAVHAQTIEELQAQVLELLNRVQQLQSKATTIEGAGSGTVQTPVAREGALQCPHISRSLKLGATGDDVTRLQRFLALDPVIYPEAKITGYYGPLTEAAVRRFQCKNKIVCDGTPESTGYGVAGPRTAAILALQCPDVGAGAPGVVGGFIRVSPVSGAAPLSVNIQANVNTTNSCSAATYILDYGDGTPPVNIPVAAGSCQTFVQTLNHVYTRQGSYTVTLSAGAHSTSATVTVGQGSVATRATDSFVASPTSGSAPLSVNFSGTANTARLCNVSSYRLAFGDGETAAIPIPTSCEPVSYSVDHQYRNGGTFVATLYSDSSTSGSSVGSISISVSGASSGTPYAGSFSVAPNASGDALSVQVQFQIEKSCGAFDLDWGDGSAHVTQSEGSCSGGAVTKEYTHQYASAGYYTITLKRGTNLSSTDVAAVVVSNY